MGEGKDKAGAWFFYMDFPEPLDNVGRNTLLVQVLQSEGIFSHSTAPAEPEECCKASER